MRFRVELVPRARRDLAALPPAIGRRVLDKLEEASVDPGRFFLRLRGEGTYRLRVGDLRVLADIDLSRRMIHVYRIGHRKNVYDRP